ncbi:MAG: hypothetical protein M3Q56_08180, partial [Bacteroidota bacterium]|nr:hypothetical protein [Bacteroidota bacterium]
MISKLNFIISFIMFWCFSILGFSQDIYVYSSVKPQELRQLNLNSCTYRTICTNPSINNLSSVDFAIDKSGQFWSTKDSGIYILDTSTCQVTLKYNLHSNPGFTNIEFDSDGVLWMIGWGRMSTYNPYTGEYNKRDSWSTIDSLIPNESSLFNYHDSLFFISRRGHIYHLDTCSFLNSKIYKRRDKEVSLSSYIGVCSAFDSIGTEKVYGHQHHYDYFNEIDMTGYNDSNLCFILFLDRFSSACAYKSPKQRKFFQLDLDPDHSSSVCGEDYTVNAYCNSRKIPITDTDVYLAGSNKIVDSIRIQITEGIRDTGFEYLSVDSFPGVFYSLDSLQWLVLKHDTSLDKEILEQALLGIHYNNSSWPFTEGRRKIQIISYSGSFIDTSNALI